jgi:hypothetical protein
MKMRSVIMFGDEWRRQRTRFWGKGIRYPFPPFVFPVESTSLTQLEVNSDHWWMHLPFAELSECGARTEGVPTPRPS